MTLKHLLRIFCVAALILLVFVGLGPAKWQPRSGLGWELDHFIGYFVLTLIFCFAWPRPLIVAGALVVFATLLAALQALPADRSSNILAAFYSACGVLVAALIAGVFIQARGRFQSKRV